MSNVSKRGEGAVEEIGGKIKETVGKVIGSERLQTEGHANKLKGQAKQDSAKSAERAKGKIEQITGAIKNRVGAVIDNDRMKVEGRAKERQGESRQKANR